MKQVWSSVNIVEFVDSNTSDSRAEEPNTQVGVGGSGAKM